MLDVALDLVEKHLLSAGNGLEQPVHVGQVAAKLLLDHRLALRVEELKVIANHALLTCTFHLKHHQYKCKAKISEIYVNFHLITF
jgi:hypothetical protein